MIFIENFSESSRDDIRTEVAPYLVHPYIKVILPKSGPIYLSATENLLNDYMAAAYAGQLLCTYATGTTHDPAPLEGDDDFEFTVPINDSEKLIEVLETLSYGFGNGDDEDQLSFWEDVEQFAHDVKSGRTTALCPKLIDMYRRLADSLEDDDTEETSEDDRAVR